MTTRLLALVGLGLTLGAGPVGAASLDATCECTGAVDLRVRTAVDTLVGKELADRIATLVAGNAVLAQDVICELRDRDGVDAEAVGVGLLRAGLTADELGSWVCCADEALLAAFARATDAVCGPLGNGGVTVASSDPALADQCARTPQCVRRGDFTQFLTRGFSTNSGGGAVSPSRP